MSTDVNASEVLKQLERSGYFPACFNRYSVSSDGLTLVGNAQVVLVDLLKEDPQFGNGKFYGLHRDVGSGLIDFRSHTGAFGKGSLQGVISRVTGDCYFDVDKFSPYADLVGFVGHTGEVIGHVADKLWNKLRGRQQERV